MEGQCGSETVSDPSLVAPGSDAKLTGEKRSSMESGEKQDHAPKRVKMRHLDSMFRSEESDTHYPESTKTKDEKNQFDVGEEDMSRVTEEPVPINLNPVQVGRTVSETLPLLVDRALKPPDLNTRVCAAENVPEDTGKSELLRNNEKKTEVNCVNSRGFSLDLNLEDVSSSVNHDSFSPWKNNDRLKSRDISECGSSTSPLKEKDSLRVWKEMKQNGFLSSSHGGIPIPKQRGRKSKNDVIKKKMEIAKKEQVDRFTKMAAPSGLLNELNPGIINHVRNSKQVHSIIEALVRSERLENGRAENKLSRQSKTGSKEISERKKDLENTNDSRVNRSQEDWSQNTLSGSRLSTGYGKSMSRPISLYSEGRSGDAASSKVDRSIHARNYYDLDPTPDNDILALKLSSSTAKALENTSSTSKEDNSTNVSSLSLKAASVAAQWLELLLQDIKGRLAALRRSKKKVRAVIQTELPFLLSKEFSSNQENDTCINKSIVDMHQARWGMLFNQMDKALSEEEKQLESWFNQVREMQLHCERGLQINHLNSPSWLQPVGTSENNYRPPNVDKTERDLAVRAAAASIYSTCNFLLSKENVPCF